MAAEPGPAGQGSAEAERGRLIVVTGLSGAGRTTALKILEDLGYEAVDNLPLTFLSGIAGDIAVRPLAIGVDSRTRDFTAFALSDRLDRLRAELPFEVRLVFLDCADECLRRRFTETRRRHPLALDRPIADGIRQERHLLAALRDRADLVIDTTEFTGGDLRRVLRGHFALNRRPGLAFSVLSFSYRQGLPREADLVFDVRFLKNPHYDPALRPLTGRDPEVGRFIEGDPAYAPFFAALTGLLLPLLPCFEREGKSYVTIAVGCTGGRHRSVFVAERLAAWLAAQDRMVGVRHRDAAGLAIDES
ncbi:MAG: RNase adapter RapZ [Dongiaceae bacterium]